MAATRASQQPGDLEALIACAREIDRYRAGGLAAVVRLGSFRGRVPDGNFLFAIDMFRRMVGEREGRLFILDNSDLVFVYRGLRPEDLRKAVEKLRLLYSSDLLRHDEHRAAQEFCSWFDLSTQSAAFLALAEGLRGERAPPPEPPAATAGLRRTNLPEGAGAEAPAALARLAQAAERFRSVRLGGLLRRQPVCALREGAKPELRFQEVFVSIAALEPAILPAGRLADDGWLFHHFMGLIDRRMLAFLRDADDPALMRDISLNLHASSLSSAEFAAFADGLAASARRSIVIEFQPVDLFADMGGFLYATQLARELGFRLCLDGLNDLSLPLLDPARLDMDYVKLRWRPEARQQADTAAAAALAAAVAALGPERAILCRAEDAEAIAFGRGLGIGLFQGFHVDALLAAGG